MTPIILILKSRISKLACDCTLFGSGPETLIFPSTDLVIFSSPRRQQFIDILQGKHGSTDFVVTASLISSYLNDSI